MSVSVAANSVVSTGGKQVALSSLFTVTAATTDPTYLIVSGLDRDEYTAGYSTAAMGSLSGNGASQGFSNIGSDAYSVGAVFTYQAATGRYYSSTYGYFDQLTYKTSTSTNDNVSLSVFTTNNASLATTYATNPYVLVENPTYFTDVGSVSVVTQPSVTGPALTQATPSSVTAAAMSFVGKAWNNEGCWVLASNIAAEAGASLPLTSTLIGIGGVANGEWIVAYNGPVAANSNWQSLVHAGEIIAFAPTANSGHITTCVSGSGSTAMLVDNITYINGNGSIANSANDGSAADIVVATPHAASQEFANAAANSVVIYELDTPVVSDVVSSITVALKGSQSLASAFTVSNPLASQAITEYQLYDTAGSDSFSVSGVAKSANSAAAALTVGSLSGVCLTAGATACSDTVEVRAYNGSYWGDWQSLAVTVAGAATPAAAPPKVNAQTANQNWVQGQVVNFTLPANTFIDPQSQKLTYSASLSNGTALPGWLTFNAATDSFSGTVTGGLQTLAVKLTATDTSGLSTFETFNIAIPAAPPVVSAATPNLTFQQGQLFCLTLPANTFTDPQGQKLTYSASLSNGAALPSWMLFNSVTATVIGVIPSGIQTYAIKLTATDTSGLSASESFTVTIPAAAPMVTAVTANQTWQQGAKVSFTLAANTFTDPQGQKLTLSASQSSGAALPSWLTFNAATGTFSGTVTGGAQSLSLTVKAADTSGLSVSEAFGVTVPSAAPTVTAATANQTWQQGAKVSFTLAANTFTDPQGQKLTLSASQSSGAALPSWLTFNAATGTFSGTVTGGAQAFSLKVTATDTSGLSATEAFGVTVPSVAPTVTAATASQTWQQGQAVSFTLAANTFTDPQGQKLTLSASQSSGTALPSWLSFNANTGTFSGTVPTGPQSLSLTVKATDTSGLSVSEAFGLTIPVKPPVISSQTPTQNWTLGQAVSFTLPANTFTDPQGQKLTYSAYQILTSGSALATGWLHFNATTDTFSGTVPGTAAGTLSLEVVATNTSGASTADVFNVNYKTATGGVTTVGGVVMPVPTAQSLTNLTALALAH